MRAVTLSVTALALAATLLTGPVFADATPTPPEPVAATPLAVRPSTPLALTPASSSTGAGWKLAGFAVLAAGGFWAWKQRAKKSPKREVAQLQILKRTAIGVRSELVLVELEGHKLLIGVTPSSMQTLYMLPDTGDDASLDAPAEDARDSDAPRQGMSERRLASLLEARIPFREETRDAPRAPLVTPTPPEDDSIYEGQAIGLRNLGARR